MAARTLTLPTALGVLVALATASQSVRAQTIDPSETTRDNTSADTLPLVLAVEARLRYEFADIDGLDQQGEALTLRVRPSIEFAPTRQISVLAEAEGIVSVLPDRLNGFVSTPLRPGVADEQMLELNRLQLEFAPSDTLSITAGRQRVSLDDERFIGTVDFRQNQQTYDAVTTAFQAPAGIDLRAGYIWRVGRVLGPEQPNGVFDSDSFFVNANAATPIGQVSLYHYDFDLDDRVTARIRSQTTGLSLRGRAFAGELGVFWEAAYARQKSAGVTPNYARAALSANLGDFSLDAKFEELGSDGAIAFQTPLATLHKFQGAADIFLVTPPDGIRDIEVKASWRIGSLGPARASGVLVQYNRFDPAQGSGAYGDEWRVQAATTFASTRFTIEAARYDAKAFATDTTRVWLSAARKF